MLLKRNAMVAASVAVLVTLSGGRIALASDANWAAGNNGSVPPGAVAGGTDSDGNTLYFCRAHYLTGVQPGKLNPSLRTCNFAYGGREIASANYEVLVSHWVLASGGQVPQGSYEAGTDTDGKPLYFCRVNYQGGLQPGKLRGGAGCFIAYGGQEILLTGNNYEVLQDDLPMGKIISDFEKLEAITGGYETDHSPLLLCVALSFDYNVQPGKIVSDNRCHFSYGHREIIADNAQRDDIVLNNHYPPGNLDFIAGKDTDGTPLYACTTILTYSSTHWSQQVGKYRESFNGKCHVGYGGREVTGTEDMIVDGLGPSSMSRQAVR